MRTLLLRASLMACFLMAPMASHAGPALDDPDTVLTVMQFTAKDAASRAELKKRMAAMREFLRKQPGYVENALMENRNPDAKPSYVGVSRWKSFKDWEALWVRDDFQKLVRSIGEVGAVTPGTFSAVK